MAGVLFGSAAWRGGDIESDIDVLLIRPKLSLLLSGCTLWGATSA